jgi:two-component system, OmpR family, sensor histidine kinase KdpD
MTDDFKRPDPEAILQTIKDEEKENKKNGKLKIFFGMAAGVGKTYAMLEAAHRILREGEDLAIGYIETHGRTETESLVKGLELLPRKKIYYKGIQIDEFDIDAVLVRKPAIVLVDELAHTNAEGSRHAKRYQDVLELLANGINVYTTLNIQHLESQADLIEKITGVKIRETMPDSVLDAADEIEFVDISPDDLIKRLAEGKVYVPDKAGLAAERFFRKGNLSALREIALNYTARIVGSELRNYTQQKNIQGPWKSGDYLLVAIGPGPYSDYLIRWTRRTAFNLNAPWIALYVEQQKKLSPQAQDNLNKNINLARELGAEVITTSDDNISGGILRTARQKNITQIVVGKPLRQYFRDFFKGGNLIERLLKGSGDIEIHVVTQPKTVTKKRTKFFKNFTYNSKPADFIKGIIVVTGVTLISLLLVSFTGYWTIALLYLLCVVILSLFIGREPVLLAAALSALVWNFLFIPPLFTFHIDKIEDALMFWMYFVIAMILGHLTTKLRKKEQALRFSETQISELYEFGKILSIAFGIDEVVSTAVVYIENYFKSGVSVILCDETGLLVKEAHTSSSFEINLKERSVAEWTFKNKRPAGLFTDTLPQSEAYYIPLLSSGKAVGVMGICPGSEQNSMSLEQKSFLQSIAYQLSVRLEREFLTISGQKTMIVNESERLYKILLNSVSHELRTPLTTITGASSSLLDSTVDERPEARKALAGEIKKAGEKLNSLVGNLLDMSRLDSGKLKLTLDWNDICDITGTALNRLEDESKNHPITFNCAENIPPLRADYLLMTQAIYNIIHNSMTHTDSGTPVNINIRNNEAGISIIIEDEGPGIPVDDQGKLFDKFYRGENASRSGLGLGLSISKGIVELHGGKITAENIKPKGARFIIYLPIKT